MPKPAAMHPLIWFRSDLRIRDNTALHRACASATDGVVAAFLICRGQWRQHDWGTAKVDFVLRSANALAAALRDRNIPLVAVEADSFDRAPKVLVQIAERHGCDALIANDEYEVNERRRDEAVKIAFARRGWSTHIFHDQTILDVSAIRTGAGDFYTVFTPFKRKWLDTLDRLATDGDVGRDGDHGDGVGSGGDMPVATYARPRRQRTPRAAIDRAAPAGQPRDSIDTTTTGFPGRAHADLWPAGEDEALRRLKWFCNKNLGSYDTERDIPGRDATSALSPYLAAGVISPRQCLHAAIEANDGRWRGGHIGVETWINELIWREFYRHVLIGFPHVCMNLAFRKEADRISWRHEEEAFTAWGEGRTGFPIVDAGMRQLVETGWMHNRLRMITAMFLTKDLFIDWRWGERFFMQHLVDGDFASNNGGWQWSASTGTDAAPYFRVFNPYSQSRKFDPDGAFIRRYVSELAALSNRDIHEPPGDSRFSGGYPAPILDRTRTRDRVMAAFKQMTKR